MKKELSVSILIVALAELSFTLDHSNLGLILHIINVFYVASVSIFKKAKDCTIFIPPSILRIVNVSMPVLFPLTIYWMSLVYLSVIPALYFVTRTLEISPDRLGLSLRYWYLMPLMVIIGVAFGVAEFKLTNPNPIVPDLSFRNLVILFLVMFVFVAFTEEFMFRSIIQSKLEEVFGERGGLILASFFFAVMHMANILFAFVAGIVIGAVFQKTRSLPCIVAIHGTSCVVTYILATGIGLPAF